MCITKYHKPKLMHARGTFKADCTYECFHLITAQSMTNIKCKVLEIIFGGQLTRMEVDIIPCIYGKSEGTKSVFFHLRGKGCYSYYWPLSVAPRSPLMEASLLDLKWPEAQSSSNINHNTKNIYLGPQFSCLIFLICNMINDIW